MHINVKTLVGTPILPSDASELFDITPDGRYLLFDRWDDETGRLPPLYSLEMHTWTPLPADITLAMQTYAPNGELIAGFTDTQKQGTVLAIMDFTTDRLAQVFNQNQALFFIPPGTRPYLRGAPTWLPDSAGLLVNMLSDGTSTVWEVGIDGEISLRRVLVIAPLLTIWKVGINGEASAIASGVYVVANSQNGRHWLLYDYQFYVMTVDATSPE